MGVYDWNSDRFMSLCKLANRTPSEVSDMFCITRNLMNKWLKVDRFPPHVGLSLSNFEAFITNNPTPIINPSHGS
jgi:hypothetical protein